MVIFISEICERQDSRAVLLTEQMSDIVDVLEAWEAKSSSTDGRQRQNVGFR
jgi:hypothetical protein